MKAILLLEDGTLFRGIGFGAEGEAIGEVVFNTSMTGYQEILTDPSYFGQIVTMTYPQIGNYGVNEEDVESSKVHVSGFVVREYFDDYSNFRAKASVSSYLKKNSVPGISEIDTRMLTKRIRLSGAMKGIISTETADIKKLGDKLKNHPDMAGSDLVKYVTCRSSYIYKGDTAHNECNTSGAGPAYKIAVLDFGIKSNILRCLDDAGFKLHVMPAATDAKKILEFNPDGVFLSNGPGDPAAVGYAIKTISEILGRTPVFGICLGHQLMAIALGAKTYKLKFGHHGGNQPVKNLENGRVEITTQNHGFSVDADSLKSIKKSSFKITHRNLNDCTIEGIEYPEIFAYSVQHHPEAGPGPHDSRYIFKNFKQYIEKFKKAAG
ncbi:MAG TPA: glutamine-hydrolyzing carbamoyl-phosphate synthase small subunit [Candidatus Humimicrobiaceae bacterium]